MLWDEKQAHGAHMLAAFTGGVLVWGGKGSKDAKLPITRGPQKAAVSTWAACLRILPRQ